MDYLLNDFASRAQKPKSYQTASVLKLRRENKRIRKSFLTRQTSNEIKSGKKKATTIPDTYEYEPIFGITIILKSNLTDSKPTLLFSDDCLVHYVKLLLPGTEIWPYSSEYSVYAKIYLMNWHKIQETDTIDF